MKEDRQFFGLAGGADFSSSEAVLGWIQEIAPYGVFTTDRELRVRSWNDWLVAHSGLTLDRVLGRPLDDVYPELIERKLLAPFERALAGEVSVLSTALHKYLLPLPRHYRSKDRELMLQTVRVAPVRSQGAVIGTITLIEDVTQRETQAMFLQRQQELDRILSAALGALLRSSDPSRDVAEIFPNLAPALALDAYLSYLAEGDGTTMRLHSSSGISPAQREAIATLAVDPADQATLRGPAPLPHTLATHARDLKALGLRSTCSFPLQVGDRMIGLLSFGSYERAEIPGVDINVLSRIARYVAVAADRTQREREAIAASRAKDDFLAALSHELRTPLNPVLLMASDAALNTEYPANAREAFRIIEKNARLEARLIDDLLDLTRIEHGKIRLETQLLDAHTVLRDALITIQPDAKEKNLAVEAALAAKPSEIIADSGRLQQVFWNLLKNAVKFTEPGGRIRVTTRADDQMLWIAVADTGIGMSDAELARVFNAFVQGDHATIQYGHRFGGLGLGLAISRKLVELHAGRLEAASPGRGHGSTFTVGLPLAVVPEPAAALTTPSARAATVNTVVGVRRPGGRILLVEDHEPTRTPLARLLMRRGFDVVDVASVGAALAEAQRHAFDLVLSDVGLPDGDGFELMRALRERHGLRGVALTGYGMEDDISRGLSAGFVAHLTKPISVSVLDRTLAEVLPPGEPATTSA